MKTAALLLVSACAFGQWIKYPTPGIPRTPDGKPNLSAPAPRAANGKVDLSGLWMVKGLFIGDIAMNLKNGELQFQPWAEELYKQRRATESKDDPTGWCVPGGTPRSDAVPYPLKVLQTPTETIILYEAVHHFRQIFLDGREAPKDPNPTWLGYSVGKWEGDTLVVETTGFNDHGWLDNFGHPNTDALHVTERFRRRDFGNMEIQVTIDDPKAYKKPWTVTMPYTLVPDSELLEYVCNENNKDLEHLVGK